MLTANIVIKTFERESQAVEQSMMHHPVLGSVLCKKNSHSMNALIETYCKWLKITNHYVEHTIPMLKAAGEALKDGDEEDKEWSKSFLKYANEEYDEEKGYGHEIWAENDMKTLGASEELIKMQMPVEIKMYGDFFVNDARKHPYAILGAKGVLEHLSILNAEKFEAGLLASNIPNIKNAMTFIKSHGVLDIEHVKAGDKRIQTIKNPEKLKQIIQGAYFTAGSYRAFIELI